MTTANENQIPSYLIEHLHKIAIDNNFITGEYKITADIGSKHGDGFVASMLSVVIDGKRNLVNTITDDQLPLLCKLMPLSEARQESFDADNIFQRELFTYNVIIPEIEKFQCEKSIDNNENGFFQYPKCYAAIKNPDTLQHFIIMEDLRPSGFKMFNKLEPIQFEHVRLLMIALGRLHGVSMAIREQNNDVWESFKPLPDVFIQILRKPAVRKMLLQGLDIAAELFESHPKELAIIKRLMTTWETDLESFVKDGAAEPFSVINHGDCWINNMVFLDDKEIRLLDFQLCRISSPVLDVTNFLYLCTTKELRDQHLDDLLHIYHDSLTEIIKHSGGSTNFTFTEFQKQFKQFGKYGLITAIAFLKFLVVDAKDIVELDEFLEKSNDDYEEDLFKFNDNTKALLKERLLGVLEDGRKFGWVNDNDV